MTQKKKSERTPERTRPSPRGYERKADGVIIERFTVWLPEDLSTAVREFVRRYRRQGFTLGNFFHLAVGEFLATAARVDDAHRVRQVLDGEQAAEPIQRKRNETEDGKPGKAES